MRTEPLLVGDRIRLTFGDRFHARVKEEFSDGSTTFYTEQLIAEHHGPLVRFYTAFGFSGSYYRLDTVRLCITLADNRGGTIATISNLPPVLFDPYNLSIRHDA